MKVLLIGKTGQLGWELQQTSPAQIDLVALDRIAIDLTDSASVHQQIQAIQPELVINAAAYTAVDQAESSPESAYAVNRDGVGHIADACVAAGSRLIHVSTDFVFDGSHSRPYQITDTPHPICVYGASKLAGESLVAEEMPDSSVIVRTAWVYSAHGSNFVKTMLRLMKTKPTLNVVSDQIGSPTWAKGLAEWIWAIAAKPSVSGLHQWTDAGVASWYDFAVAIQTLALEKGLLETPIEIRPIPSEAYPTPAQRPAYSVLDKQVAESAAAIETIHWRKQLSTMLDQLTH